MRELPQEELIRRAKRLKLVLSDNDGVLTDTGVYYSERGEEMKRYSIRDGMGVERLRNHGVETAIITGENSPSVRRRAEKLQMPFLYLGIKDKVAHIQIILKETGLAIDELAYIGDDVNDLRIMEEIGKAGILACPGDAMPVVQEIVNYTCAKPGGNGAFRDFAEWILTLRNH
ncbi:MAG: HAD-IIIA family hydrolase [Chlorobiales bacterium]|jgi:3-deoxy-D-manno-octulosonate 8-phosphate phosphatase (KDO 8-P phosphatase)|nr:HAD-IIIA family hydrolase [Chlorobiales bacterium]